MVKLGRDETAEPGPSDRDLTELRGRDRTAGPWQPLGLGLAFNNP